MLFELLTDLEKTLLLTWFRWHLSMEDRRKLMRELPIAYAHLVNRTVPSEDIR